MQQNLKIGCVADDFTGASDAASLLVENGLKTIMCSGIPDSALSVHLAKAQAVVIALKSRTQETNRAVEDSLAAFRYLHERGAEMLYFKYCSTFDSTPQGNIGPVIDAVLESFNIQYTVICPAMLPNKRTVKDGILYVDGIPLAESHMKNHPLTPMWSSDLIELMKPQGKYSAFKITGEAVENSDLLHSAVHAVVESSGEQHFYVITDYNKPYHGVNLACQFAENTFMTGGSGLLGDIASRYAEKNEARHTNGHKGINTNPQPKRGRLILAGSCSKATQKQVQTYINANKRSFMVKPDEIKNGALTADAIVQCVIDHPYEDYLIYSAGSAGMSDHYAYGDAEDSNLIEITLAETAKKLIEKGIDRLIVAGGETSGAVMKALGYEAFEIGQSVAPGVPVMYPLGKDNLALVLKSGNFGGDEFFLSTLI